MDAGNSPTQPAPDPGHASLDIRARRPAWIDVDLEALAANLRRIRAELPPAVRPTQVVKAAAYSVSCNVLAGWRSRLPRKHRGGIA